MIFNKLTVLAVAASVAELASAATVGRARIVNNCQFPVTVHSVDHAVGDPHTLAAHGGSYGEGFRVDPKAGGIALKITNKPDGLYDNSPETIFSYSLKGDRVWYDMSTVFGANLKNHRLVVASSYSDCGKIDWQHGEPPAGSQVKDCKSDKDVTLTLCAPQ